MNKFTAKTMRVYFESDTKERSLFKVVRVFSRLELKDSDFILKAIELYFKEFDRSDYKIECYAYHAISSKHTKIAVPHVILKVGIRLPMIRRNTPIVTWLCSKVAL